MWLYKDFFLSIAMTLKGTIGDFTSIILILIIDMGMSK